VLVGGTAMVHPCQTGWSGRKRSEEGGHANCCCRCARARRWNHFQRRRPFTGRRWPCPGPGGSSRSTSYS